MQSNWKNGHHTLTHIKNSSGAFCLQYDDGKIVSGHQDSTIKACALCVLLYGCVYTCAELSTCTSLCT